MKFKSGVLSALAVASTSASHVKRAEKFVCGSVPDARQKAAIQSIATQERQFGASVGAGANISARATINVRVYIHVVAVSSTVADGNASDQMLNDQFNVINQNFAAYDIAFTRAGTDRTINANWARGNDADGMKRALHKGTYADLNLYVQRDIGMVGAGTIFGLCVLPLPTNGPNDDWVKTDGCQVITRSLPGGSAAPFNTGKTAVHEVGHWFGLLHTFENGCNSPGDEIDDTPYESGPPNGCPTSSDSCPNQPGLDPIHNHMDYSDDNCRTQFTSGQKTRMFSMWNTYRAGR